MKQPNNKNPKGLEIDGGLVLAMIGSGVLCIPLLGFLPLLAIGAAVATSIYIADNIRLK